MIGIVVALASGLALIAARAWFRNLLDKSKKKRESGDEVHRTRYSKANTIQHMGACHCQRIRFRVRAPRVIHAVDLPSKIRFPRITVPCDFFEPLTDETIMSLYACKTDDTGMGVHTFCSYCGVHILFSPSVEPVEVQINVDCLDRSTIEHVYVSYLGVPDSVPCPVTYEAARPFNRRGAGSLYVPILSNLCSPMHKGQAPAGSQQGSSGKYKGGGSDHKGPLDFNPAIWGTAPSSSSSGGKGANGHGGGNGGSGSSALSAYYGGGGGGTAVGDDTPLQVESLFQWGLGGVGSYAPGLDVDRYHHTLSPTPRKLRSDPVRPAGLPGPNNWTPQYRQLRNHLAQYLPPHSSPPPQQSHGMDGQPQAGEI